MPKHQSLVNPGEFSALEGFLGQYKDESTGLLEGYQRLEQILAGTVPPPETPAAPKS